MAGGQVVGGLQAHRAADENARLLRIQAENTRAVGEAKRQDEKLRTRAEIGQAAAGFGASGGEIATGSSAEILGDIAQIGDVDARRIRQNAENEALFLESQASLMKKQGDRARTMGFVSAAGTLLTMGSTVAGKWDVFKAQNPNATFSSFVLG